MAVLIGVTLDGLGDGVVRRRLFDRGRKRENLLEVRASE
jgi:hypothetical protein